MDLNQQLARELSISLNQIAATVALLDEGATVPFIARYRKEATGGLSDTQLRDLEERLFYLRELNDRKQVILKSIEEQGKLTPELTAKITATMQKAELEDLYLPHKPKRRTKAQIAIEAGLAPLAAALLADPTLDPNATAGNYLNAEHNIATAEQALEGARFILMEQFAENADLLGELRTYVNQHGILTSLVVDNQKENAAKFTDYFDFKEALHKIPAHRVLAVLRGQKEGFLRIAIAFSEDSETAACYDTIARHFNIKQQQRAADQWLWQTVQWAWQIKIKLHLDSDIFTQLRENAEENAIDVFKDNLKNLLMASPAGEFVTLGLDPGFRTGVKCVVVDGTGKLLAHDVIYPHAPQNQTAAALAKLAQLCKTHHVKLVSIGNGTASRETDRLVAELMKALPDLNLIKIVVSEAGASVYSASALAAKEFPDLDVSYRGAVSIARRLQDPLAELVKIDPKSIGVGQYQHDVNQVKLSRGLNAVLEDCVNAVGADLNTASVALLTSIAGLSERVAQNIVNYREQHGAFRSRQTLKQVPHLGEKTFEQAAGFLRIRDGEEPLDASAVHPEAYSLVSKISQHLNKSVRELISNAEILTNLNPQQFVDDQFGLPTVRDVLQELQKPGRDPRPAFKMAIFADGIETLADLKPGQRLEGVITNVTSFGAFVDIGVHQDGLVHISELADQFVKDPKTVVKVGDIVKVTVLEVDVARKRIQLSMRTQAGSGGATQIADQPRSTKPAQSGPRDQSPKDKRADGKAATTTTKTAKPLAAATPKNTAFSDALLKALK